MEKARTVRTKGLKIMIITTAKGHTQTRALRKELIRFLQLGPGYYMCGVCCVLLLLLFVLVLIMEILVVVVVVESVLTVAEMFKIVVDKVGAVAIVPTITGGVRRAL